MCDDVLCLNQDYQERQERQDKRILVKSAAPEVVYCNCHRFCLNRGLRGEHGRRGSVFKDKEDDNRGDVNCH